MKIVTFKDAKASALIRYFTGVPCKYGHTAERMVSTRACVICKNVNKLRWQEANPEKHRPSNIARCTAWREQNRDRHRAGSMQHYLKNREEISAKRRERWKSCPEIREAHRRLMLTPKHRANAIRRAKIWTKANPDKSRAAVRAWIKRHPEKSAQYNRNRRAREMNAVGSHTAEDVKDIFRLQGKKCAYCRVALLRTKKHIDHIIPLSCGGSNHRSNLQILCQPCNLSKNARDPIEFAQSLGR